MSTENDTIKVLSDMMIDKADKGGRRLIGLATDVATTPSGRDSIDPIHIVIAATQDEKASSRAKARLAALGINATTARKFERMACGSNGFKNAGGDVAADVDADDDDEAEADAFTPEAIEMLHLLNMEHLNFIDSRQQISRFDKSNWDWYNRLLGQALDSESPAVQALRQYTYRN